LASQQISVHDLPRVREIARVLGTYGFGEIARLVGIETRATEQDIPRGKRIRLALAELGPTFIKLGQVLSVRPDILPADILAELATLQDNAPRVDPDAIRAHVEEELGGPIPERFARFEDEPVASASIAQVHLAELPDGREVAVKVQRPGIERVLRSDMHILYTLARLLEGRTDTGGWTPVAIVQEFDRALSAELDFLQEAAASERFRRNHQATTGIVAPAVHLDLSTRRVLVMERIRGTRLSEIPGGSERGIEVMRKIIESWYLQLFEHGFFHGDPHPGNLMVLDDGSVAFLDFGMTGVLTGEMQEVLTTVFTGLAFKDADAVALAIYRAGATSERVDLRAFRGEIERMMAKYEGASLSRLSERGSLTEFVEVAARYRILLPREYAVLARATSIVDGIGKRLLADADIVEEVRPWAQRLVARRLGPDRMGAEALRAFQHAQIAFRDLPAQASQLLVDLERGRVVVVTRDPDADALRRSIGKAAGRLSTAVIGAGCIVGSAIIVAAGAPRLHEWPLYALATTLMGLLFVVATAGWFVYGGGDRATRRPQGVLARFVALVRFFRPPRE
jgi:ubiquinone biosynthesis protein